MKGAVALTVLPFRRFAVSTTGHRSLLLPVFLLLIALPLLAADFQAGVARAKITPLTPYWLSGYASRTAPAPTVLQDLWAKALALRDPQGHRVVFVTLDLIGLPGDVSAEVVRRAGKRLGLEPSELLLNCSHTHCGPAVGNNLSVMFDFSAEDAERVRHYTSGLTESLVLVIGEALRNKSAATVSVGRGSVGFAVNRRAPTATGFRIGVNTNGPTDHTVPVLRVTTPDGQLRAVLFGYACHNTTLGGDIYQINGDYAGCAQVAFEKTHPGATALFLQLCGGDQNPNPRGTVDLARQHGESLAAEVERVLGAGMRPVSPVIRRASQEIQLDFAPHTRQNFEEELKSPDKFKQRRARLMLAAYDKGQPIRRVAYPVQAIRLGGEVTFLGLGGEVVIDYSLRARREFAGENLIVSGYCHDVMCYIPSKRVLHEGGYEALDSMIYYGQPGPFADTVEEKIFAAIHRTLNRVGIKPAAAVTGGSK